MLAHTMEKLRCNTPHTPRNLRSNIPNPPSLQHPNPYPLEPRGGYPVTTLSRNSTNDPPVPAAIMTPRSTAQREQGSTQGTHHMDYFNLEYQKKSPLTPHSILGKAKSQILRVPLVRKASTQETWKAKLSGAFNKQLINDSETRVISPFQTPHSEIQRLSAPRKNDTEMENYQQQINSLKERLSQSYAEKLSLELKLNKASQLNKQLQSQIGSLRKQMELQFSKDRISNSSIHSQSDTIIQLLSEYQETKRIIEKLMEDNQHLLLRNQELVQEGLKANKKNSELQRLKIKVMKIQNEKFSLLQQVQSLMSELEKERKESHQNAELDNMKANEEYENAKMEMASLKQQVETLKKHIRVIKDVRTPKGSSSSQAEMQEGITMMAKEIEQYAMAIQSKDQTILQLNEELSYMGSKLKEVLAELTNFSQAFQIQKAELTREFEAYKHTSSSQIASLKLQLAKQTNRQPASTAANTIYIEATDLKQTKTRITGGYEAVILGKKPPTPVVTSVRTVSELPSSS